MKREKAKEFFCYVLLPWFGQGPMVLQLLELRMFQPRMSQCPLSAVFREVGMNVSIDCSKWDLSTGPSISNRLGESTFFLVIHLYETLWGGLSTERLVYWHARIGKYIPRFRSWELDNLILDTSVLSRFMLPYGGHLFYRCILHSNKNLSRGLLSLLIRRSIAKQFDTIDSQRSVYHYWTRRSALNST